MLTEQQIEQLMEHGRELGFHVGDLFELTGHYTVLMNLNQYEFQVSSYQDDLRMVYWLDDTQYSINLPVEDFLKMTPFDVGGLKAVMESFEGDIKHYKGMVELTKTDSAYIIKTLVDRFGREEGGGGIII